MAVERKRLREFEVATITPKITFDYIAFESIAIKSTLFPLPRNRKKGKPTDAETLLHAMCLAIRDHKSHKVLRDMISHLPRIMHRANPFNATQEENARLEHRVGELEGILRKMLTRVKRYTKADIALAGQLEAGAPKGAKPSSASAETT